MDDLTNKNLKHKNKEKDTIDKREKNVAGGEKASAGCAGGEMCEYKCFQMLGDADGIERKGFTPKYKLLTSPSKNCRTTDEGYMEIDPSIDEDIRTRPIFNLMKIVRLKRKQKRNTANETSDHSGRKEKAGRTVTTKQKKERACPTGKQ